MTMNQQKLVALDIGGVCITLHPERVFRALGISPLTPLPPDFLRLCDRHERGLISQSEFLDGLAGFVSYKGTMTQLADIWNLSIGPTFPGMLEAVRLLHKTGEYRFVFFSNTSDMHMRQVCRTCELCPLVTGGIFSYETGSMKPEASIYTAFEQTCGVPFAYFDDRMENMEAALSRGWNAFLFTDAEHFLADLNHQSPLL